jgi:ABC-2 type transport system ATP-binding protein
MTSECAIEAAGLTKVFRSFMRRREVRAVDGISLRVSRGSTFGFLGPNGAGKTTFVKMLLSATRPTSGAARIFGLDANSPEARRPIGYLPENHRFPTYFTGAGMLDFYSALSGVPYKERKRRIGELLALVGLEDWGGVRVGKYSKGMLQRLGLAQAMMHEPELLILDEPSDGVDPVGRIQIREILHGLEQKGVTIFINSHLLVEVELFCSEVAILNRGKVALTGKVKDLTAGKGYRVTALGAPERLVEELRGKASNGVAEFHCSTREEVNRAIDLLRAAQCEIEAVTPTASSLEEIFINTVENAK